MKLTTVCNTTLEDTPINEVGVWKDYTFHNFGLVLSAVFGMIAILMSWYLIWRHATHYLKPYEQRHIIRVLFMVPIYAFVSFLSYYYYKHAVYFEVIRDCYEAFAIASFFALLCHYIAPDLRSQKDYFRGLQPKGWVLPISWFRKCCGGQRGPWRTPRSGLTWFNIIWFGVFQYCFVRVFMTLVAVGSQAAGRYCLDSLSPVFLHVWVMVIEGACVTVAMYCLIQFYIQMKDDLAKHHPLLKVLAIKLVIFLSFWQTIIISFLTSSGAIKPSPRISYPDIKVGIPSLLLCIEMAIFSVFHLWAFPWKVYDIRRSQIVASESTPGYLPDPKTAYRGGPFGIYAMADVFNPWDLIKAVGRGFRWFAVGRRRREQDISYLPSKQNTGLEPSRSDNSFRRNGSMNGTNAPINANPTRYHRLGDDEDATLLSHAQSVPQSGPDSLYPRPGMRLPDNAGDIGAAGIYNRGPDHLPTMHPTPGTMRQQQQQQQQSGTIDNTPLDELDTGYHGATQRPAHAPPTGPPRPPGRPEHAENWSEWGGAGSERDLGRQGGWEGAHF